MATDPRAIELLAPAADKEVAKAAILQGADAVYMGASSHGARKRASNSLQDIKEVVEFAHTFRAKVYVTVNTLVYDSEIETVRNLVSDLYRIGVDAIIVQDMAILEMDIPPIALHASTQCDTRTVEKARFLEEAGFSQLVLARELSIAEIKEICRSVTVPVECFIHGALCVSYSGRCAASCMATGRSANRGECSQMCRMPYTLRNSRGEILLKDKYFLSLRDFNASPRLEELLEAGVSSLKIEGRLKDSAYVKNVTAYYRQKLDAIIKMHPDKYRRASSGSISHKFTPALDKSFNRGFTTYFLDGRHPGGMASIHTPKSMGETVNDVNLLRNGDGISFFNEKGEYEGINVNGIRNGRIIGSRKVNIPKGREIHRTSDIEWAKTMAGTTAVRSIAVDMILDETGLTLKDERGLYVRVSLDCVKDKAAKPLNPERILGKLGNTVYYLRSFSNHLNNDTFIPASDLAALRRRGIEALNTANLASYRYDYRRMENPEALYPSHNLDARDNVANKLAHRFYSRHGVQRIRPAVECGGIPENNEVMTTRYCILRELGVCKKSRKKGDDVKYSEPMTITTGPNNYRLAFDCSNCEMRVFVCD